MFNERICHYASSGSETRWIHVRVFRNVLSHNILDPLLNAVAYHHMCIYRYEVQRIPLTLRRPANRGALQRRSIAIATDGTSCSATKSRRDGICRLSLSSADEDGVSALKSVVAGLVTAAFVVSQLKV